MTDQITTDFLDKCTLVHGSAGDAQLEELNYVAPAVQKLDIDKILAHSGGTSTASAAAGIGLSAIA